MERDELAALLLQGESETLDWKADFPPSLRAGSSDPRWEGGKGELLKDLSAVANSLAEGAGYIVYGVKDHGDRREVLGRTSVGDDADFQTWSANSLDPPVRFVYSETAWDDDRSVGVFSIHPSPSYPHVVSRTLGGKIFEGQVWRRRGSRNTVALRNDLEAMFRGEEHVIDSRSNGPIIAEVSNHYEDLGREPCLPRWVDRQVKLRAGFEYAYFPGTRRIVVVIPIGNIPDLVLMLRPESE